MLWTCFWSFLFLLFYFDLYFLSPSHWASEKHQNKFQNLNSSRNVHLGKLYLFTGLYFFQLFSTNYKIRNNVVVLAVTQKKRKQNSLALVCILNHRISSTSQFVLLHFFYFKFPAFRVVLTFIVVWWQFFYMKIKSD